MGGGQGWGIETLEYSAGHGGGKVQERVPSPGTESKVRPGFLQMASYFGHSVAVTDVNRDG